MTDEALAGSDVRVRIPIRAEVDSLNVATAAAIAFHRMANTARAYAPKLQRPGGATG